ncbi:unnamed protein product [Trichobilharzia szidati]|nr:unnamed protein product [Trichobilharzia szidati]
MISSIYISKTQAYQKSCALITQIRNKKYYRKWWIPYHLDDYQTITRTQPNGYEKWDQEWNDSHLPSELQFFDTSRLPTHLKARSNPSREFFNIKSRKEQTEDYRRRLFGEYGFKSGINPAYLFMDEKEVSFEREKEKLLENSVVEVVNAKQEEEIKTRKENEELMLQIKKNLEKMPELLKKYYAQEAKQSVTKVEKTDKMNMLLEEARDRFGYYPHKNDPKFLKLVEEFSEQNKLGRKQKKDKSV